MRGSRTLGFGLALVASAALTGCVQVPDHGRVVEANSHVQVEEAEPPFAKPLPPQAGAAADDIVAGFLEAMIATPLTPIGASEYLTTQARTAWQPDQVLSYTTSQVGATHGDRVDVRLHGTERVGARGQWVGRVPRSDARLSFRMEREDGEWRIAHPPDALILPRTFYDQNYQDASLYYFDPSGRILVPEPVHVPQGLSLRSSLVRDLLRAPRTGASSVIRTFIPAGLSVPSVPVTGSVAEVNLKGTDPGPLDPSVIKRIVAQLSWTLRQDPSVNSFTLTIAGRAVTDVAGSSRFPVRDNESDLFDPSVSTASPLFYALRSGRLVSGQVRHPSPVMGPFGNAALGIGPFAVNLHNTKVAGVRPDSLLVGRVLGDAPPIAELTEPDLLRPSWDFADRLWEVRNGRAGASVMYFAHGRGHPHPVRVPGISGEDVRRFLVSRDGSRIVALLRGRVDHILVSRLQYNAGGVATGATHARRIPWLSEGTTRIRDLGWTSPTTIAVLDRLSPAQAEVRILNVDGSTTPDQAPPRLIRGLARGLATSPSQPTYAVLSTGLTNIANDTAQLDPSDQVPTVGLRHVTYAG